MPEQDLKQCLFEHARKYQERYETFKRTLGETHETTIKCENKYLGCYFVLSESGLLEEYETWSKNQEKESDNSCLSICLNLLKL